MTIEEEIQAFLEHYDYDVPNPEHEPKRFAYYVKMWRYYISKRNGGEA